MVVAAPPTKKQKQKKAPAAATGGGTFSFHPEDESLQKVKSSELLNIYD
jgi:hypothetical protein